MKKVKKEEPSAKKRRSEEEDDYSPAKVCRGVETTIILDDGGNRCMGYVTPASPVQLVSKLCKLFWNLTLS